MENRPFVAYTAIIQYAVLHLWATHASNELVGETWMLSFSLAICYHINYVKRCLTPCCGRDDENCSSVVLGVRRGQLLRILIRSHRALSSISLSAELISTLLLLCHWCVPSFKDTKAVWKVSRLIFFIQNQINLLLLLLIWLYNSFIVLAFSTNSFHLLLSWARVFQCGTTISLYSV